MDFLALGYNRDMKLPLFFKYIFWSYDFSKIDTEKDINGIIIDTINYGGWKHWKWIFNYYGKNKIKKVIENTPKSEFKPRALRLASLLLNIKKMKYAFRIDRMQAEKNIR